MGSASLTGAMEHTMKITDNQLPIRKRTSIGLSRNPARFLNGARIVLLVALACIGGWFGGVEVKASVSTLQDLQILQSGASDHGSEPSFALKWAKNPIVVPIDLGAGGGAPALSEGDLQAVIDALDTHARRLVTINFINLPLRFSQLPRDTRDLLLKRGGPEVAGRYDDFLSGQVLALIDGVRTQRPNAPLAIRGIPFEGQGLEVRKSNGRYADIISRLDAFVVDPRIMVSNQSAERDAIQTAFPAALEFRGNRPILYRMNLRWRMAVDHEDLRTSSRVAVRPSDPSLDFDSSNIGTDEGLALASPMANRILKDEMGLVDRGSPARGSGGDGAEKGVRSGGSGGSIGIGGGGGGSGSGLMAPAFPGESTPEDFESEPGVPVASNDGDFDDVDVPNDADVDVVQEPGDADDADTEGPGNADDGDAEEPGDADDADAEEPGDTDEGDDPWDPGDEVDEDEQDSDDSNQDESSDQNDGGESQDSNDGDSTEDGDSAEGDDSSDDEPVDEVPDNRILVPDEGWSGPVGSVDAVGHSGLPGFDAPVIARWNVVPNQTINESNFDLGILAFHVNHIDRVEIAVDGGPAVILTETVFNPRTGVDEFVATLDSSLFPTAGHLAELRAVIYPRVAGQPTVLEPLPLMVSLARPELWCAAWGSDTNGDGTKANPFRQPSRALQFFQQQAGGTSALGACDGLIVNLEPGEYEATAGSLPYPSTEKTWLTIRGEPGADRSSVRFVEGGGVRTRFIRFANVTFDRTRIPSRVLPGGEKQSIWIDGVHCLGMGPEESLIGIQASAYKRSFVTSSHFSQISNGPKGVDLVRGTLVEDIGEDAFTRAKMVVDCEVRRIVPNPGAHSDVYQIFCDTDAGTSEGVLIYGLRALDATSQQIFLSDCAVIENIALVNLVLLTPCEREPSEPPMSQIRTERISNVIVQNLTLPNQAMFIDCPVIENFVIRSSLLYELRVKAGSGVEGIIAEQNHFVSTMSYSSIILGTGATQGSVAVEGGVIPMLGPSFFSNGDIDAFRPIPQSVISDRIDERTALNDATGIPRTWPAPLGGLAIAP